VHACIKQGRPLSTCLNVYRRDGSLVWLQVRMEHAEVTREETEAVKVQLLCLLDVSPMMSRILANRDRVRDESCADAAQQVSETQEEAIVHALDCIEMMSVGHPARDKSCSQGW